MQIMTQLKWLLVFIVIGLLALVSISPFLSDTMSLSDDANLHVYRSIVLDDSIRNDGSLYPRYTSALAYGYGASLFNYFPPTSYYPTVIFQAIGLSPVHAWKATIILFVLLAGIGMFLWARQWVDDTGAFIAATAYLYAPYTLFDTVTRGSSNEFAGMALLPFAMWGFTRLARSSKGTNYLTAVFSYALFIIAHNVMTLYGTLLLIAYCGFLWWMQGKSFRVLWQLGTAGIFAVLITAFFWLPALSETDFVKINGVLEHLDFVDVTNTLRSIGDVFAIPRTADPSQHQAIVPISFSWIAFVLAIVGFFLPQPPETENQGQQSILGLHIFLFVSLGIVIFSQLEASTGLWQSVKLLQYSQFAWRPMSIGSLVLALLAGIGGSYIIRLIPTQIGKNTVSGLLLAMLVLYSIPWLYRPQIDFNPQTVADAQAYELSSRQITLSSYGEYLPAQTEQSALNPLRFESELPRLQENDDFSIISLDESNRRLSAEVDVSETTVIVAEWLYVPGWRARVNGKTVDVISAEEAGFVSFEISEGQHDIEIWYAGTGIQNYSTFFSVAMLVFVIGFVIFYPPPMNSEMSISDRTGSVPTGLSLQMIFTVGLIGLLLFGLKTQLIDRSNNLFRNSRYDKGTLQNVDLPLNINFDNQIRLIAAEFESSIVSGDTGELRLYWTLASEAIDNDYSSLVRVIDSQGIVIAESSNFYPGGLASRNWLPGHYLEDIISLNIPDFTTPKDYTVVIAVFQSDNGIRLDILNEVGNPIAVEESIARISIERPESVPAPENLPSPLLITAGFELLSVENLPETAQVGDEIDFSWLWRAFNPEQEFTPQLVWNNTSMVNLPSIVVDYPISEWQVADAWRGHHRVFVPATLPEGDYAVSVQVGGRHSGVLHNMTVTVPERNFDIPEFENELETIWQNGIQLQGYEQSDSTITLYWHTETLIDESLRLFVQVFNEEGQILAIDDGIPMNGQRPTSGWITDEFITTNHLFNDLAPEAFTLLVGWYNEQTGERIYLSDSDSDALELLYQE